MSSARTLRLACASLALIVTGACTTGFPAQVSRFQAMPAPQGQSFFIQAANPRDRGGLEFAQYASVVRQNLVARGFAEAASPNAATLVVSLDYGVDNGQTRLFSYPSARYGYPWGRFGYFRRPYAWGWHDPFIDSYPREIDSYTVFTSFVDLDIKRTSDGQSVFEGTAKARSRTDELPRLVPNLVEALFTNFPGRSGETVKITVLPPERPR